MEGHRETFIGKVTLITDKITDEESRDQMVLDVEHEIIGLIVGEVSEVVHLRTEDIEPTPVDIGDDSDFL